MSDFGDWDEDDAWAEEGPDAEQVAKKIHDLSVDIALLSGRTERRWDALNEDERQVAIGLLVVVIAWLRRQGALRD